MDVRRVDPRDTQITIDRPIYRVFFWQRLSQEGATSGFRSSEHEITGASDVHEVSRWAEANAGDRTFTIYVVVDATLVRLSGKDPTAATK